MVMSYFPRPNSVLDAKLSGSSYIFIRSSLLYYKCLFIITVLIVTLCASVTINVAKNIIYGYTY